MIETGVIRSASTGPGYTWFVDGPASAAGVVWRQSHPCGRWRRPRQGL